MAPDEKLQIWRMLQAVSLGTGLPWGLRFPRRQNPTLWRSPPWLCGLMEAPVALLGFGSLLAPETGPWPRRWAVLPWLLHPVLSTCFAPLSSLWYPWSQPIPSWFLEICCFLPSSSCFLGISVQGPRRLYFAWSFLPPKAV